MKNLIKIHKEMYYALKETSVKEIIRSTILMFIGLVLFCATIIIFG